MGKIKKIIVSIQFSGKEIELGELVEDGDIYFKYYTDFINLGLQISPFKLPLNNKLNKAEQNPFDGLYGVFNDSLPDGWGRLLLDRKLLSEGILPAEISPLDRLAYVGSNGMGALIYRPEKELVDKRKNRLDLDSIYNETEKVYEGTSIEIIEELFSLGGSSGGARPKIFIGYNTKTSHLIHSDNQLPKDYEHWIIKFPSSTDLPDIAQIEYAYYKMALAAGIEMTDCKLFAGASGKKYFGTKRFDRNGINRLHIHSACGLLHDNYRRSSMDYGHLMDCTFQLEKNVSAYEKVLRMATFNIYTHNRDDHSKNFSFLMNEDGTWKLAPAYDLTFSSSSHGMHSTTIAREGKFPGEKQLLELASDFGVKNGIDIIQQVKTICVNWTNYAKEADVTKNSTKLIDQKIKELIKY
ncbi:MAG: phosphatidylinositol kinase [Bacteroidetes bacterium RIFCSPLOWO2_12_FULL_31_6]|nr:MAG: phosphatidylinositol kinase [Bacteroidetes bacterium RIFCSPLOWO2_12_FULL_31_6]